MLPGQSASPSISLIANVSEGNAVEFPSRILISKANKDNVIREIHESERRFQIK